MTLLAFFLGLLIGVGLLIWQRFRFETRLKWVLSKLHTAEQKSPFSFTSELALAIGRQQVQQQQLEQQLETYRILLHHAPISYLQVDDENRLIWCNQQAKQLLGIAQEADPNNPRLLLELVRSYELDDLIETTRERDKPCQRSWMFYPISADPSALSRKEAYPMRGYGLPLSDHRVGVFLENRQETMQLMQQRDRWTSDLAHELKTPLTSIRLVAEMLQPRLEPPLQGWVDRLINETVRLSNLVQDLLDLSRIQRESLNQKVFKSIDLVALTFAVWGSLEPLARHKHLWLSYDGPNSLVIQADETRIHRLLVNLLDNSIKYSPPDRAILLRITPECSPSPPPSSDRDLDDTEPVSAPASGSCLPDHPSASASAAWEIASPEAELSPLASSTQRHGLSGLGAALSTEPSGTESVLNRPHVCLDIIDFGSGFAPKDLPFVFERFYRADPSRARTVSSGSLIPDPNHPESPALTGPQQTSSGLGLAIVRQIVEAHHGTVVARNHPDTGGAWLQVRLPLQLDGTTAETPHS